MHALTDHPVGDGGEDNERKQPQRNDVAEDLGQEVDGHTVVTVTTLVQEEPATKYEQLDRRHVAECLVHDDEENCARPVRKANNFSNMFFHTNY